jgi:hypothetical protein
METVYTIGLSKIEVGNIAGDGGMGNALAQLGYTNKDSCSLTQEDPEKTDFFAEEVDDAVVSISRGGKTTFNFAVMSPDVNVLASLLGGTVVAGGGGDPDVWNAPDSIPVIEKSVRITPNQGLVFEIPRMNIVAKINGQFSKSNVFVVEVTGTVLQPTKANTSKMKAYKLPAA